MKNMVCHMNCSQRGEEARKVRPTRAMLYLLPVNSSSSVKPCNRARPGKRQRPCCRKTGSVLTDVCYGTVCEIRAKKVKNRRDVPLSMKEKR
jgi:hypothetical protein